MAINPIPENHNGFIPYLIVKDADKALDFYEKALGGRRQHVMKMKDGSVMHAEVAVANTRIMLTQENEKWNMKGPKSVGGCPLTLTLYVEDVDAFSKRAIAAGMEVKRPVEDHFYGDRMGTFVDPDGYEWCFGSRLEDLSETEIQERAAKFMKE